MAAGAHTNRWVALLRGINVGGGNKLPMAQLRDIAGHLGWTDVATYIASGNLLFSAQGTADQHAQSLCSAISEHAGLDISVVVLSGAQLRLALAQCPYHPDDPKQVHLFFLLENPDLNQTLLEQYKASSEELCLINQVGYFHTPDGYGRSKLADRMPKVLGCAFTARNLRSVNKLCDMLDVKH